MKNYGIAVALAFFLGGLGAHKFYLGNPFMGILYFLFSWTFIPMLISVVETIVMLMAGKNSFNKKHNPWLMS